MSILIKRMVMPSTVVARMDYDEATRILRITFVSGLVYDYLEVPKDVYVSMKESGSKGIFLNRNIKNKYHFRKVKQGS
jgi:hypothetical protein